MGHLIRDLKLILCVIFIICILLITSQSVVNAAVASFTDPRVNNRRRE